MKIEVSDAFIKWLTDPTWPVIDLNLMEPYGLTERLVIERKINSILLDYQHEVECNRDE